MNKHLALAAFILLASTGAQAQESQQKIAVKNRQMIVAITSGNLKDEIVGGAAPDDPWLEATLKAYFPDGLGRFEDEMKRHRCGNLAVATDAADISDIHATIIGI